MVEKLRDILEAQQFDRSFLELDLFPLSNDMKDAAVRKDRHSLKNKIVCHLFYEPSTRTRISFETATTLLGGTALSTENAAEFSSAIKGETLEDTARIIEGYYHDAIVLRHKEDGAASRAASVVNIPVLNAGDGKGQHPTQALLDVYTIHEHFKGELNGLRVAMVGDLAHGRTINSLSYLLAKFEGVSIDFVSPPGFGVQQGIKDYLFKHSVPFFENKTLKDATKIADVVYMTRVQDERLAGSEDYTPYKKDYRMDLAMLENLPQSSIVMHPLPRNDELPPEVDVDKRVIPFKQAQNGLFVRMALLEMLLA
ncbi:MAG: aspartate carbamoyltransferase [Microgenomates group bacterium]|jgi:aspartate carbamoyltransferase catalytic subunit